MTGSLLTDRMMSPSLRRPLSSAGWPGNRRLMRTTLPRSGPKRSCEMLKLKPRPERLFFSTTSCVFSEGRQREKACGKAALIFLDFRQTENMSDQRSQDWNAFSRKQRGVGGGTVPLTGLNGQLQGSRAPSLQGTSALDDSDSHHNVAVRWLTLTSRLFASLRLRVCVCVCVFSLPFGKPMHRCVSPRSPSVTKL